MKKKDIDAIYQLSPSQQGMLFETLARPGSGIYIEQNTWTLAGHVDADLFTYAWQQTLDRHPALRTCFIWQNQENPLQVVLKSAVLPLDREDWRDVDDAGQHDRLNTYLQTIRANGFALNKAPLMRLGIFRTDDTTYQCVWSFHHILMDGWCLPLVLKDVLALYVAATQNPKPALPPVHAYVEYIRWLQRQPIEQAEVFWHESLDAFHAPTPLGTIVQDDVSTQISKSESPYAEYRVQLSESLTLALQGIAQQHRLTLSTLLQGLWGTLLCRYSGQWDVVFGATVSGRPAELPGVENIIGLFINTVPVRTVFSPETSLLSWFSQFQEHGHTRQMYEYCSAGQIRQWCPMPHSLPLYDSIVVFENYPLNTEELSDSGAGFTFHDFRGIGAQTRYALTLLIVPGQALSMRLIIRRQHFVNQEASQILPHFERLLQTWVAAPEQSLEHVLRCIPENEIPGVRSSATHAERECIPPGTATEKRLLSIWQELLGHNQISIDDNFFELGGHSLLAAQLATRIRQQFQIELPLHNLFQEPTIAGLARLLDSIRWTAQTLPIPDETGVSDREEGEI